MTVQALVIVFMALTGVLIGAQLLAGFMRLPIPTVQFLFGALVTNVAVLAGLDTGLRYDNFHDLVFFLFLPLLVFAAAYELPLQTLRSTLLPVLTLAGLGILITAGLVAVVVYYGMGYPDAFPWLAALLCGVLLAATDPAAVTGQLGDGSLNERTAIVLEGESLFNDATAVVLFTVVLAVAIGTTSGDTGTTLLQAITHFVQELGLGLIIGGGIGYCAARLNPNAGNAASRLWISMAAAFAAYHLTLALHGSGVIACLICGLWLNRQRQQQPDLPDDHSHWQLIAKTANGFLFALVGATVTLSMFTQRWLAMLIAIAGVIAARLLSVHLLMGAQSALRWYRSSFAERQLIGMLGMRGAITIALVLILPIDLPYWWNVQSIAYGVVVFDLLILAPLAPALVQRWG